MEKTQKTKSYRVAEVAAIINENTSKTRRMISAGLFGDYETTPNRGGLGGGNRLLTRQQIDDFLAKWVKIGKYWVEKGQEKQ